VIELDAGAIDGLRAEGARLIDLPRDGARPRQAILVLDAQGTPRAYLNECRHLPVPLDGGSGELFDVSGRYLLCGTHGALYETRAGVCIEGPCIGQRLVSLGLRRDGERLWLDPHDPRRAR